MKIPKGKFGLWLENFWYHYKWHTIFALVAILVVTICTVQMCSKEEYDVHIVYAGSEHLLGEKDEDGTVKAQTVMKSVNQAVEDFDGNGKILSSFESLYLLTDGEILELERELADKKANNEGSYEVPYAQIYDNKSAFSERLTYSDCYVFIISENLYLTYQTTEYDVPMFVSLRDLVDENSEVRFLDDGAVYLNSTEFGQLPGLSDLPENTVIALRSVSALSSHFDKEKTLVEFENSKKVVENMLNYGK